MPNLAQQSPAILYEHPLLGEGIAKYLRSETGVEAALAPADDLDAVKAVLAADPAVVIFERSGSLRDVDLSELAPHAEFFDVSEAVCRGPAVHADAVGFDRIVQAVRRSRALPQCAAVVAEVAEAAEREKVET